MVSTVFAESTACDRSGGDGERGQAGEEERRSEGRRKRNKRMLGHAIYQ